MEITRIEHQVTGPRWRAPDLHLGLGLSRLKRMLRVVLVALVATNAIAQALKLRGGDGFGFVRMFDSDVKLNVPSAYKELMLVTAASLAALLAAHARARAGRDRRGWLALAGLLAFGAFDELTYLHQSLGKRFDGRLGLGGAVHFAWVVLYLPVVLVGLVVLVPFVLRCAEPLRTSLFTGLALFAGGSGLLEMVKGEVTEHAGNASAWFVTVAATSDTLEEIGLAVLVVALAAEVARRVRRVHLVLRD